MHHTLVALVEDKPGVLNRVASLFRRRAFNIESLTVGRTDVQGISRMTIVLDSDQVSAERVTAYLYKLVNVLQVEDLGDVPAVARDLALVKVTVAGHERAHLLRVVDETRAHIVDSGEQTMTLEITGEPPHVDAVICNRRMLLESLMPVPDDVRALEGDLIALRREIPSASRAGLRRDAHRRSRGRVCSKRDGIAVRRRRRRVPRRGLPRRGRRRGGECCSAWTWMPCPSRRRAAAPYASRVAGAMHACGHDGHVSMGVGAARLLAQQQLR